MKNKKKLYAVSAVAGAAAVNKTGDPNFTLTNIATITYSQLNTMIASEAHMMSITRFIYFSYNVTLRAFLSSSSDFFL